MDDARYHITAIIPVIPVVAGLAKIITSGDFSDAHTNLANFVEGAKIAVQPTSLYIIYVGMIWFMSSAAEKVGRPDPVGRVQTRGSR
ncbi:MAG: hypothetical protein HYT16_00525 [DPANN group archaeon]|nr:hypothetical protein [DPANN group archaeon]